MTAGSLAGRLYRAVAVVVAPEAGPRPASCCSRSSCRRSLAGALTAFLVLARARARLPGSCGARHRPGCRRGSRAAIPARRPAQPIGISIPPRGCRGRWTRSGGGRPARDPAARQGGLVQRRPAPGGARPGRGREPRGLAGGTGALREPANAAAAHAHPGGGPARRHPPVPARPPPPDREEPVPPDLVYAPSPRPRLVLITCGGPFTPGEGYRDNVILYARAA